MKIYKTGEKIIVELDFWQPVNNPYEENTKRRTHNLIGVIAGDDYTISQLIDLDYKGSQQEGMPLIHYNGDEDDFKKLCKELGIDIWNLPICEYCNNVIRGTSAYGEKGFMCGECELKGLK